MSYINSNWYIALAFCLFFFIGGRQLAEVPGGTPKERRMIGVLLFAFSIPALLFPLAYFPGEISISPWYNTFRSIDRIELFSALIAPAAGYTTYRKPELPYKGYHKPAVSPFMRLVKPLAFPFCVLFISINFIGPLLRPLDSETTYEDIWTDEGVFMQSAATASGPAALISAMYSLNNFADSELNAVKGTYTDQFGTEFWYLARYAVNRGYKTKFAKPSGMENAPVPSVLSVSAYDRSRQGLGPASYIALLGRSKDGILKVGDPAYGMLELTQLEFAYQYGDPRLIMALSFQKR